MTDSKPLKHGEAVAIGIICESFLSFKTMKLDGDDFEKIIKVITKFVLWCLNYNKST
jgi:3-dehydroquinate synthase